jgi:hypothetical protein
MEPGWEEQVLAAWDRFAFDHLGPAIREDAKRYAPVSTPYAVIDFNRHPRTRPVGVPGELRSSIGRHMDGHTLVVVAAAPYAAYVELGTRPHPIDAHGPWSLWNPRTGERFGPHVHHPGATPRPFLRPALYQHRG